jgi:hypothetical protein
MMCGVTVGSAIEAMTETVTCRGRAESGGRMNLWNPVIEAVIEPVMCAEPVDSVSEPAALSSEGPEARRGGVMHLYRRHWDGADVVLQHQAAQPVGRLQQPHAGGLRMNHREKIVPAPAGKRLSVWKRIDG